MTEREGEREREIELERWVAGDSREERWRYVNAINTNTNRGNQFFIQKYIVFSVLQFAFYRDRKSVGRAETSRRVDNFGIWLTD